MKKYLVFIDAETDGLYGSVLSVAMIVTDFNGNELEEVYYGIKKDKIHVTSEWVKENVLPRMGQYEECDNEQELLDKAWRFWLKYEHDAYMIGDVCFPVETGLLTKCVKQNVDEYMFKAPFPLLDISSMLLVKGYDPLAERKLLCDETETNEHNALFDARMSVTIWNKLIAKDIRLGRI